MKQVRVHHIRIASALFLLLGLLTGCLTIQGAPPDSTTAQAAPGQFQAPRGKSRIFFFHGPVKTCKGGDCIDQRLGFPFSMYIDGVQIGTLSDREHFLRADIDPGEHLLQWKDIRDSPEVEQGELVISMEGTNSYFIRVSKDNRIGPLSTATMPAGPQITGRIENLGTTGQAEISGKALIVADQEAIRRISLGRGTAEGNHYSQDPSVGTSIRNKLAELKDLYDQKLITKDEYDGKRKQLLDSWY